ncbi:MAG: glycerophosphodiester phosphodiesterase, partial [Ilumatobacteraceae bacterium]
SDGVLVIHHDDHLADGRTIVSLNAAELPTYVPTLGAALDACAGMWVNVEIKNDPGDTGFDPTESIADETIAHLLARHEDGRWVISCFRIETVDRCRDLAPQVRTAWLTSGVPAGTAARLAAGGHSALHPWVRLLTRDVIDDCHANGIAVNTWTCDDPVRMAELIEWGIDGICTNVPDVALTVRADRPA